METKKDLVDIFDNPSFEPTDDEAYNEDWDCHASPADGCNCPRCRGEE